MEPLIKFFAVAALSLALLSISLPVATAQTPDAVGLVCDTLHGVAPEVAGEVPLCPEVSDPGAPAPAAENEEAEDAPPAPAPGPDPAEEPAEAAVDLAEAAADAAEHAAEDPEHAAEALAGFVATAVDFAERLIGGVGGAIAAAVDGARANVDDAATATREAAATAAGSASAAVEAAAGAARDSVDAVASAAEAVGAWWERLFTAPPVPGVPDAPGLTGGLGEGDVRGVVARTLDRVRAPGLP